MKVFLCILVPFIATMSTLVSYEVPPNKNLDFSKVDSYDIPSKCGKCGKYHLPGVPCS